MRRLIHALVFASACLAVWLVLTAFVFGFTLVVWLCVSLKWAFGLPMRAWSAGRVRQ